MDDLGRVDVARKNYVKRRGGIIKIQACARTKDAHGWRPRDITYYSDEILFMGAIAVVGSVL